MTYSEDLAERIRELVFERPEVNERKMFSGVAWMLSGNMAVGVMGDRLMVRLSRHGAESTPNRPRLPNDCGNAAKRGGCPARRPGIRHLT